MKGNPEIEKTTEKRIGLFGGTFNPIHLGHLRGAEEIREAFGLQTVVFIPAAVPPHKKGDELIDPAHRLEMVKRATASNSHFSTTDIELSRTGKSYSIDTLRSLLGEMENSAFFILGRDAFVEIETWKDYQNLFSLCNFIVMTRPGSQRTLSSSPLPVSLVPAFRYDQEVHAWTHPSGHTLHFEEITYLDISSTRVRELIEKGGSVRYLIPPEVETYIRQHRLYRKD